MTLLRKYKPVVPTRRVRPKSVSFTFVRSGLKMRMFSALKY